MNSFRNFGMLLTQLSRRYARRFEERAQEFFLTLPHCKVLVHLERHEGLSQIKLAEVADIEPMTMVRILDHMEAGGLLERRSDPADRRARRLYLTDKAKPLLEKIWRISDAVRAEVFAGVSAAERQAFIAVLERIYDNVCAFDNEKAKPWALQRTVAERPTPARVAAERPALPRPNPERLMPQRPAPARGPAPSRGSAQARGRAKSAK